MNKQSFAEKLKKAMNDLHLSQKQVVGMTGCSKAAISQYLSCRNTPPKDKQRDIAVSLGLDPDYFQTNDQKAVEAIQRGEILRLLPEQAAKILGVDKQTIRKGLQQGCFPWGYAIQMDSGKWVYIINAKRFAEIEGVPA